MNLPFIIDLFDDVDPVVDPDPSDPVVDPVVVKSVRTVTAKDPEAEIRLRELEDKHAKSNAEAAERRRENKALKAQLDTQSKMTDAIRTRTIRTEAKMALREAGALHDDVLEIFLKKAGDKVKVDDSFDVLGIEETLKDFKESHKALFKQPEKEETAEEKAAREEKEKSNKTATGASTSGGSGNTTSTGHNPGDKRTATQILADQLRQVA